MTATQTFEADQGFAHVGAWHLVAIVALATTGALIHATGTLDTCTLIGRVAVFTGWLIAPITALAALTTITVAATQRTERRIACATTTLLTIGWFIALAISAIGPTINQTHC